MTDPTGAPLTRREREVCNRLCLGMSNKEIAVEMGISHRTVEDHRWNLMKKLGARNTVQIVRKVYGLDEVTPA